MSLRAALGQTASMPPPPDDARSVLAAQLHGAEPTVEAAVHDPARLAAVARSGLLELAQQDSWDGLTSLAARLLGAPMAFLTVVDDD